MKDLEKKQILRCTQNDKTATLVILNAVKDLEKKQILRYTQNDKKHKSCHPERSEGSQKENRFFVTLRMTKNTNLVILNECEGSRKETDSSLHSE